MSDSQKEQSKIAWVSSFIVFWVFIFVSFVSFVLFTIPFHSSIPLCVVNADSFASFSFFLFDSRDLREIENSHLRTWSMEMGRDVNDCSGNVTTA